jgi:hypothetical protein
MGAFRKAWANACKKAGVSGSLFVQWPFVLKKRPPPVLPFTQELTTKATTVTPRSRGAASLPPLALRVSASQGGSGCDLARPRPVQTNCHTTLISGMGQAMSRVVRRIEKSEGASSLMLAFRPPPRPGSF